MTVADAITAFSAAIAAISFVYGISAWKRKFVGKRRIELAEIVLTKFYEAAEVIRAIRSPFHWREEGKSRQAQRTKRGSRLKRWIEPTFYSSDIISIINYSPAYNRSNSVTWRSLANLRVNHSRSCVVYSMRCIGRSERAWHVLVATERCADS